MSRSNDSQTSFHGMKREKFPIKRCLRTRIEKAIKIQNVVLQSDMMKNQWNKTISVGYREVFDIVED